MNKKFHPIAVILVIAMLCATITVFSGCSQNNDNYVSPDALKVELNNSETFLLDNANTNSWYKDVELNQGDEVKITDFKGKVHNLSIENTGRYTLLMKNNGSSYEVEARPEKKTIIWVTALLSGGLYDFETQTNAWDPLPYTDIRLTDILNPDTTNATIGKIIGNLLKGKDGVTINDFLMPLLDNVQDSSNFLYNISLDNYGKPKNPNLKVANDMPELKASYGVLNAYIPHYQAVNKAYEGVTEFHIFNYDWRLDIRDSAKELEKYIEDNKFTNVLLFAHSMGGNVVANYLANSKYNRDRIIKYVSVGGSFLGSFDTLYTMENMKSYFGTVVDSMGAGDMVNSLLGNPLLSNLLSEESIDGVLNTVQEFVSNLDSFVQLLPSFELISGKQYGENGLDGDAFVIDGKVITTADELYNFYESRPWAWQRDENNEYVMNGDKHVLRKAVRELRDFHDSQYVFLPDGSKVFSTTLVDTVYVSGLNVQSFCGVVMENGELSFRTTTNGDLQVLFYSGIVNLDADELRANNKLIEVYDGNHIAIGCYWELVKDMLFEQIASVFGEPVNPIE